MIAVVRVWENRERKWERTGMKEEKATFVVNVLYRNAATWQGNLHWLEGDKESAFRSELELLSLMDSVLDLTREKKRNSS
ncbi:hypothetical protein [Faecalispora sporosphaeroides]|nr:hypothetical protein [Faecalispora sporosphaeroides]